MGVLTFTRFTHFWCPVVPHYANTYTSRHAAPAAHCSVYPVQNPIQYKIAVITFNSVHGTRPAYFRDVCHQVASVEHVSYQTPFWRSRWFDRA